MQSFCSFSSAAPFINIFFSLVLVYDIAFFHAWFLVLLLHCISFAVLGSSSWRSLGVFILFCSPANLYYFFFYFVSSIHLFITLIILGSYFLLLFSGTKRTFSFSFLVSLFFFFRSTSFIVVGSHFLLFFFSVSRLGTYQSNLLCCNSFLVLNFSSFLSSALRSKAFYSTNIKTLLHCTSLAVLFPFYLVFSSTVRHKWHFNALTI